MTALSTSDQTIHHLYRLFADVLEYPTHVDLAGQAKACADLLLPVSSEAAALLDGFRISVQHTPPDRMDELYLSTLDLPVVCLPYVGHQLFGASY